jgi:hypothetical protein
MGPNQIGNYNSTFFSPGNPASYNAEVYSTPATYNAPSNTPGNVASYNVAIPEFPATYNAPTNSPGNIASYNASVESTPASYNAPTNTPGNVSSYNSASASTPATYNSAIPARAGSAASAFGITLPGAATGQSSATFTPATKVSAEDSTTYPVEVPEGGEVIIRKN